MSFDDLEKRLWRLTDRPQVDPPPDFTPSLMTRLPDRGPQEVQPFPGGFRGRNLPPFSFHMFLASFGHVVLAGVLALGLKQSALSPAGSYWLNFQPPIILFLAAWLFLLGFLGRNERRDGSKKILVATLGYAWIVLLNVGVLAVRFKPASSNLPLYSLLFAGVVLVTVLVAVKKQSLRPGR